jgi:anti-sigma-K factor RskA
LETLLPAHPGLRRAVQAWQARLMPLADAVAPVAPRPRTWLSLQARLDARLGLAPAQAWWQRLLPWQLGASATTLASVALAWALVQPAPVQPPVLVVLAPQPTAQAPAELLAQARFVASVSGDGRALVLRPLAPLPLQAGRTLELWALPSQGAPRSLGLVAADRASQVQRAQLLQGTTAFAVSIEPSGGSPTGAPTGPVISVGGLES